MGEANACSHLAAWELGCQSLARCIDGDDKPKGEADIDRAIGHIKRSCELGNEHMCTTYRKLQASPPDWAAGRAER